MTLTTEGLDRPATILYARIGAEPAHLSGDTWTPRKWALLRDWLGPAFEMVEGNTGAIVSWGQDHVQALFRRDTAAALDTAIAFLESALDSQPGNAKPVELVVVVVRGEVELATWESGDDARLPEESAPHGILGDALLRARQLADIAVPGALLIDTAVLQDISLHYLKTRVGRQRGWTGADYLAPVRELRRMPESPPTAYYEVKWSGEELMRRGADLTAARQGPERKLGVVSRWNAENRASIQAQDGEIYWCDATDFIGGERVPEGDRVSFVVAPPRRGDTRTATAILGLGTEATGVVVKVFERRRYAFLTVADSRGQTQEVFLHADDNEWPLSVGDRVRFTVGENVRGAVAVEAQVIELPV